MDNSFGGMGGLSNRRNFKGSGPMPVSASKAVQRGLVAELERPLPEGAAAQRNARRIPALFKLHEEGSWIRVSGDISKGGALLLLADKREGSVHLHIQLANELQSWSVTGEIIGCEKRGERYAHHVRFVTPAVLPGLNEAIERTLAAGEKRLETV